MKSIWGSEQGPSAGAVSRGQLRRAMSVSRDMALYEVGNPHPHNPVEN